MARPIKDNADYFTHDKDMRNDPRIKAVRRKFPLVGYYAWNMLLEVLTDASDFTVKYNDLQLEILAGDFELDPDILKEVVEYLIKLELIILLDDFIFCPNHIARFSGLIEKRKKSREEKLNNGVVMDAETPPKLTESVVLDTETCPEPIEPVVSDTGNTQSIVEYSKVKKSKEEKKKEKVPATSLLGYSKSVDFWLKDFHVGWQFGAVQGKAIKSILCKLEKVLSAGEREVTEETLTDAFKFMCISLPEWFKDKDLQVIDSKFNEVIEQIKTKKNGQNTGGKPISKYHPG